MALPKRRHSRTRRDKRRTHDALRTPAISVCTNCKRPKQPHRVCPHCGQYRGRQVVKTDDD